MKNRDRFQEFDDIIAKLQDEGLIDGRLTDPQDYNFDMLAIINYCKANNIEPETLTDEDLEKFPLKDYKPCNPSRYVYIPLYKRISPSSLWRKVLGLGKFLFPAGRPTA